MRMELTALADCPTPHTRIGMPQFRILGPGIVAKSLGAQLTRPAQLVTAELWFFGSVLGNADSMSNPRLSLYAWLSSPGTALPATRPSHTAENLHP